MGAAVPCARTDKRMTSASTSPGAPTTRKAMRQPRYCVMMPPDTAPIIVPIDVPMPWVASALARRSGGKASAIMEWDGALHPASPTPTPMRYSSSWPKLAAVPHSMVMADQAAMHTDMMDTRSYRSHRRAMGTPITG